MRGVNAGNLHATSLHSDRVSFPATSVCQVAMNRYGWIVVRAYLPAAVALACAVAFMLLTSLLGSMDATRSWVPVAKWLPLLALLAALASGTLATWRTWRWQRGGAKVCAACNGPLGSVHHGNDGAWQRCQSCGAVHGA